MQLHVIGNGESNNLFDAQYGYVMACNIPEHNHRFDAITAIDARLFRYAKEHHYVFKKPVYTMQTHVNWAHKANLSGTFIPQYVEKHRYNSGHHAVEYLSTRPNVAVIHIWGFDSMWSDNLTSEMDVKIKRPARPNLNTQWRPHWINIFARHSMIKYIVHKPSGTKDIDYGQNCNYKNH
jgi:hypothetical protein